MLKDGISIIVTVYNKEPFIKKTLISIIKQMTKNCQLIIIDDGSTDNSEKIIKETIPKNNLDIKLLKKRKGYP